jgi:ribosome maturation protein SDO1
MSQQIYTPINQVKLTNVAVVRMNKGGKRFEIACYKNKVVDYRAGLEQDLSEVLQTERIFTNVSKGEFAKAKDMLKVFGTKDEDEISKLILSKGQLQVSDKERTQQNEKTSAQIAEWISKNCVHPESDRPYTISQIRHAMQQANISIHPTKPLKRQYLDCVKLLQKVVPIQRAKMELLLLIPSEDKTDIERTLKDNDVSFPEVKSVNEDNEDGDKKKDVLEYKILVDPSLYRILNDAMEKMIGARIEIVNQVVTKQGDVNLELEVGNHKNNKLVQQNEENTATDSNHAAKLLSQVHISSQDKDSRNDNRNDNNDRNDNNNNNNNNNSDNEDEEMSVANRRKAQKKKKKKNQKANRRIEDSDTNDARTGDTSTTSTSNQLGSFEQSSVVSQNTNNTSGSTISNNNNNNSDPSSTRKSCNTCGGSFDTPAEFRTHFKSDWHKFNQKLKMSGSAPIGEEEFLLCDSDAFFSSDII